MIAYFFPPMGGVGVQRTLKFVRYLPDHGWQPYVLTVKHGSTLQDTSLGEEIPTDLPINRTFILHLPSRLPFRLRNFITRWFLIVDEQIGWFPFATSAGRKVIVPNTISVIYSSSSPYTSHLVARKLHHQTGLPWVADFRDPWVGNPFLSFPTTIHRRINENLERRVFSEADRVILNTQRSLQHYQKKYSSLNPEKFLIIPNGYDQADLPAQRTDLIRRDSFTLVHLGSLYQKSRSASYFLSALYQTFQSGKLPRNKVRVRFIGNIDRYSRRLIERYSLDGQVELLGFLPHRVAMEQASSSDLLLLIPYYGPGAELFIPAKIYEYLASRIPILYLDDTGESADLIRNARAGWLVAATDIDQIADTLARLYQLWEAGELTINSDMDLISSFERRELTRQLADLFTDISS